MLRCNVGCEALSIPTPCLLSTTASAMLHCALNLSDSTLILSSGGSGRAHRTGRLSSFAGQSPAESQAQDLASTKRQPEL